MTITNGYGTVAQFAARFLNGETITGSSAKETQLEQIIQGASRLIDLRCDRQFWKTSAGVARYFTPYARCKCIIDDLVSATEIAIDTGGDGLYSTVITTADYWFLPQNPPNGEPYQEIEIKPWSDEVFVKNRTAYVKVTGTWGWNAVPDLAREACLLQAFRWYKRDAAPFGIAGGGEFGQAVAIAQLDPDVELMLAPLVRVV